MKKRYFVFIFIVAVIIAIAAGFFASSSPDGLERVAKDLKVDHRVIAAPGIISDYTMSILNVPGYSTAVTGIFGIIIVFFLFRFVVHGNKVIASIKEIFKTIKKD
jgi:hypothetical protein